MLTELASEAPRHGYRTSVAIDSDDTWLATWANDDLYVLVQAAIADARIGRSLIDVHAGGAYGARPNESLYEALATSTWRFDYGGPWARRMPDGLVSFGWRTRLPSELFSDGNASDAFGFLLGMIDAFGFAAGTLARELIPAFGGHLSRATDPYAFPNLLAGILPPQE